MTNTSTTAQLGSGQPSSADIVKYINDVEMRELLSAKDVGKGRSILRRILAMRSPVEAARAEESYPDAPMVCAELYQVIGCLAYHYGIMEHPDVQKALDNASQHKLVHADLLPWPKQDLPDVAQRPLIPLAVDDFADKQLTERCWDDLFAHIDSCSPAFAQRWKERLTKLRSALSSIPSTDGAGK